MRKFFMLAAALLAALPPAVAGAGHGDAGPQGADPSAAQQAASASASVWPAGS